MNTEYIREAASVKRCHVVRTIGEQTIAEHSYFVAMLCWRLCDLEPSADLLKAALFHDLAEVVTGDIPATMKWASPEMRDLVKGEEYKFDRVNKLEVCLTPKEELVLKWADGLELAWYCVDQLMLGNRNVEQMYKNITGALEKLEPVKNGLNELFKVKSAYAIANTR